MRGKYTKKLKIETPTPGDNPLDALLRALATDAEAAPASRLWA